MPRWTNENTWDDAIRVASSRYNVPVSLIKAIIGTESAFRPTAYRGEVAIGDGSIGLMQILLNTARGEGYTGPVGSPSLLSGLYDPPTNIVYGTAYLASCLSRTGSVSDAISAYNGGVRPDLGFGAVATRQVTVCLARDATGKCIQTKTVMPGHYANEDYVGKVLGNLAYFEQQTHTTPTVIPASPPLGGAYQSVESEADRRINRAVDRPVGTPQSFITTVLSFLRRLWWKE